MERKASDLPGKRVQTRNEDITLEIQVPEGVRSKHQSAFALHVVKGPRVGEILALQAQQVVLGRGIEADLRIDDPSLSRMHARFERQGDSLLVTDLASRNGTFVEGQRVCEEGHWLKSGELITLGSVVLRFSRLGEEELEQTRALYEAAVRDRLTGLYNRGYFDDRIAAEFAYVKRHGGHLAVLLLDLDHFKQVNDTHGHGAGDALLRAVAKAVCDSLRAEDVAARYGGEEFVVLARGTDAGGAQILAERLRECIGQTEVEHQGVQLKATTSVGVAVLGKDLSYRSPAELVAGADVALYASKHAGRNRVTLHAPGEDPGPPRPAKANGAYAIHGAGSSEQVKVRPRREP